MFTSFTLTQNEIVGDDYVREGKQKQKAVKAICRQKGSVSNKDLKLNTDVLSGRFMFIIVSKLFNLWDVRKGSNTAELTST